MDEVSTVVLGQRGEELAVQALVAHGYEIIARNWHCPAGEIDIIAHDADGWAFVEVKLRRTASHGSPEEAVTHQKQKRLLDSAALYMQDHDMTEAVWRIDVVAIDMTQAGKVRRLEIHRDAIRADG